VLPQTVTRIIIFDRNLLTRGFIVIISDMKLSNVVNKAVSQHFLLSAKARTLSLASVARMSEDEARATFRSIRWAATDGEPVCPECGCVACYEYASRPIFKCKGCLRQFSLTSGTIFSEPQAPGARLPAGHRDLRERRQGAFGAPTQPRS
jgi:hypothetical protein